jgi:hypothetical protein
MTGELMIRKRIDLESADIIRMGGLLEFKIIAFEIGDETSITINQVTIAIVDINDNKPQFASDSYRLSISPNSPIGTSLTLSEDSIHVFDFDKVGSNQLK